MKENEMIHTGRVLIVEGKYDAARLSHLTDAMILLTDGFGIYSDKKRQQLFKALAQKNGLILLTDSYAAGFRIRTYITNLVGEKNVVQAYVPAIHGKEKRKEQPGKEAEKIDQARAEASKKRAEEILAQKNLDKRDYELAQARLKRALVRTSIH